MTLEEARSRIDAIFAGYQQAIGQGPTSVLPASVEVGKTYEAWVLAQVLAHLHRDEQYKITLRAAPGVVLKTAPGPIKPGYAHFELDRGDGEPLEVWTDIEFLTLSARERQVNPPQRCDYHELDVLVVTAGADERPGVEQIRIGVECKATPYRKELLRGILGVRRELSLLQGSTPTGFGTWPRAEVPAEPPSCLLAYGTDNAILKYAAPGATFGIDFKFEPLP